MFGEEPSLRDQLVEARSRIAAQLEEIRYRATAIGFARRGGPPDYGDVTAELEEQLREIDALLSGDDSVKS